MALVKHHMRSKMAPFVMEAYSRLETTRLLFICSESVKMTTDAFRMVVHNPMIVNGIMTARYLIVCWSCRWWWYDDWSEFQRETECMCVRVSFLTTKRERRFWENG